MAYQLYYYPGACSLASHIVMREAGVPFEIKKVDLKTHKTEDGKDFYEISAKGYVPALRLDNGEILTEGPAILQYIADSKPDGGLLPKPTTLERARVLEWLNFVGTELHTAFSPLYNPATSEDGKNAAKAAIAKRFDLVEKALADGRAHLTGERFTIADAYLFVVANWTNFAKIDLSQWPKLKAFHARVGARAHAQAAMKAEGLI